MQTYRITVMVTYQGGMVVEETYEVQASNVEHAEQLFWDDEAELVDEVILNYSEILNERVTTIRSKN